MRKSSAVVNLQVSRSQAFLWKRSTLKVVVSIPDFRAIGKTFRAQVNRMTVDNYYMATIVRAL